MTIIIQEIAEDLFTKFVDIINNMTTEIHQRDTRGKLITRVRLSTSEKFQEDKPWKDVFYLKFYFDGEGLPIPVGIGSLTKNQITLNIDLVPELIRKLLSEKFLFSVIAVSGSFDEIKKTTLPFYQSR